jgi:DNA-binding CsgD family transcriptional regulator
MNHAAEGPLPLDLDRLSPAERRVVDHALAGRSAREIADLLVLSEATVRSHLSRIYTKLGVGGQVELLARAAASTQRAPPGAASPDAVAADRTTRWPSGPVTLLLVGVTILSLIPPVAVVVGPGLLITAWLAGRQPESSSLRAARPWLVVVGVIITVWAAFLLIGLGALIGTRTGGGVENSPIPVGP